MYLQDCFALKPFGDHSLCSVCILPQPAFYSQSAVCILHTVCILPLVRSLQSAARSLRFTLTVFFTVLKRKQIEINAEWKKKRYVKVSINGFIFCHFNYTTQFPCFLRFKISCMHELNACKLARDYTAVSTTLLYDRRPKCFSAEWCCFYANYVKVITFVHVQC